MSIEAEFRGYLRLEHLLERRRDPTPAAKSEPMSTATPHCDNVGLGRIASFFPTVGLRLTEALQAVALAQATDGGGVIVAVFVITPVALRSTVAVTKILTDPFVG